MNGFHEWTLISIGCAVDRQEGLSRKGDGEMRKGLLKASPLGQE